jgi:ATP-dependent helicase/nuclease subunit A
MHLNKSFLYNRDSRRPDRVMMSQEKVIVLDYKFGEAHNAHQKQVQQYTDLLRKMGHASVKGYLWYVQTNQVAEV